jgi:tRNA(Ile)-lysidine synthase
LQGAAGILERRGDGVVRPLLGVTRRQTVAYISALGLTAVHDPMNDDRAFTRVRVRHEVLPALVAATGPGTERALARFAALAFEDDSFLMAEAKTGLARAAMPAAGAVGPGLDRIALLSLALPIRRRALALYFEVHAIAVDAQLIDDCLEAIARKVSAPLPGELLLTVRKEQVAVEQAPARTS